MAKINVGRVLVGGIIAAVVIDVIEGILNGAIVAQQWTDALAAMGKPPLSIGQVVAFNVYGLILGFTAIWIYAAIRPRFGAGPRTAVYAAITLWVPGYFVADWGGAIMGAYPTRLFLTLIIVGFFEIILATLAGACFYREDSA